MGVNVNLLLLTIFVVGLDTFLLINFFKAKRSGTISSIINRFQAKVKKSEKPRLFAFELYAHLVLALLFTVGLIILLAFYL